MVTAIEQRHREQNHAAACGTGGAAPSFAAVLDMIHFAGLPTTASTTPSTSVQAANASPVTDTSRFVGQSVGSGQCVALVRAAHPDLGPSATWAAGAAVQGNTSLRPGTPIATFTAGHYANATDGTSHAAIYLGQDANGLTVLDQWAGNPAAIRTIPWNNPTNTPANTGKAFRVVLPT